MRVVVAGWNELRRIAGMGWMDEAAGMRICCWKQKKNPKPDGYSVCCPILPSAGDWKKGGKVVFNLGATPPFAAFFIAVGGFNAVNLPIAEYFRPRCVTRPAVDQLIAVLCYKYWLALPAVAACYRVHRAARCPWRYLFFFFTSVILFCDSC